MAAKKTTTHRGRKSEATLAREREEQEHKDLMNELLIWGVLIVSIILLLCVFNLCGPLSNVFGALLFGLFGFVAYIFPFLLFFSICFYRMNSTNKRVVKRVVCSWILYAIIAALFQLFSSNQPESVWKCYVEGYKTHFGGGFIGACISRGLSAIVGNLATGILLVIIAMMLIAYITGKLIASFVVDRSTAKYNEYRQELIAERKRRREEREIDSEYDRIADSIPDEEEEVVAPKKKHKRVSYTFPKDNNKINSPEDNIEEVLADTYEAEIISTKEPEPEVVEDITESHVESKDIPIYEREINEKFGSMPSSNDDSLERLVARALESDRVQYNEYEPFVNHVPIQDIEEQDKYEDIYEEDPVFDDSVYEESLIEEPIIEEPIIEELVIDDTVIEEPIIDDPVIEEPQLLESEYVQGSIFDENSQIKGSKKAVDVKQTPDNEVDIKLPPEPIPYVFPSIDLLDKPSRESKRMSEAALKETAKKLQECLKSFKVDVTMTDIICGPTVTRYELQPSLGTRVKKITELENDIKLNLAAADIRIEAPIPGKSAVGIEVPNPDNVMITLREMLETKEFNNHKSNVAFAVGKDIGGRNIVSDIAKMPHMLIAGSTGSGKSVCINTIVMSILYKADPNDVKLIMIDPKVVELSVYNGIPHLAIPVVTDPKKAAAALNWAVAEMNDRYSKFAELGVRDMKGFNEKVANLRENPNMYVKMPQIVIIVDELADLMMVASHDVETAICRLAQMARAAGLHLIIATQRPSVDVITGLIKANVPSRIAFAVSSAVDSRTILDGSGAEKLLGKGDMLFFPQGLPKPVRVQGAFVSDVEVARVTDFVKGQYDTPVYDTSINDKITNASNANNNADAVLDSVDENPNGWDEKFEEAGRFIIEKQKASIGTLQRVFKIGFNRGARIMDQLCEAGVVSEEDGKKPRNILMTMEEFEQLIREGSN